MRWRDQHSWTSVDSEDSIVITVIRDRAKIGSIFGAVFIGLIFALSFFQKSWVWLAFGLVGLISVAADRLRGNITQLTVTTQEFVVRGNVARTLDDHMQIGTKGLRSLEYFDGGEDEPSGFYAKGVFWQTCLLPGLNREQTTEIALLIKRRFPDLEDRNASGGALLFENIAGTLLFGNEDELTSLNLSKPEK